MTTSKRIVLREPRSKTKLPERSANALVGILDVLEFAAEVDVVTPHDVHGYGPQVVGVRGLFTDVVSDDRLIAADLNLWSDAEARSRNLWHIQTE